MGWLLSAVNWVLLTLGDIAQWLWHDGLGYAGSVFAWLDCVINPVLAPVFAWINVVTNAVVGSLFAMIGQMPGWLSNTIISAVMGVVLLVLFKYTSNQKAIGQVKDTIKANMLALKLFKDELQVTFQAQGRVFLGALQLLRHSLRPLFVMIVPVLLILAQMGLWYQWRPLRSGEEAMVTMRLNEGANDTMPDVQLMDSGAAHVIAGPVRIASKREICWQIRAGEEGRHEIIFQVGDQKIGKELVIGDELARVSAIRPGWEWTAMILHPIEKPFANDSPVHSIAIDYPDRTSWTSGTDWWMAYFFVVSIIFALIFKPFLNVKI